MTQPAELRFVQLGALALRLNILDETAVLGELLRRHDQAPSLLSRARLVLDLSGLADQEYNETALKSLIQTLTSNGFPVIGLVSRGAVGAIAKALNLPVLGAATELRQEAVPVDPARPTAAPAVVPAMHVDGPVRSGQQIYARDTDLVIAGSVSAGAEVIADGSVHVYGSLRGRALAGAGGNESARVYSLDFQAELVSVAGNYKVFEELPKTLRGGRVQAWLDDGQLKLASL
ncbi:MAG: septum site-determining protein MinC [Wenzhouxiangella sp.]